MTAEERVAHLTATRTVAISTAWNLFGRIFPMLIAIAATPFLLQAMGLVRWGIFSLALALMSTFGIFDIGLGRALIRTIAHAIAVGEDEEAAGAAKSGILALAALGVVFAILVALGLSGFSYSMQFDDGTAQDKTIAVDDLKVFIDPMSLMYLEGVEVDFLETLEGSGFKFNNPNVKHTCGCGSSFQV